MKIWTPHERAKELCRLIMLYGPSVTQKAPWCDGVAVLGALAEVESSFGQYAVPKHEMAYDLGGRYYNREHWTQWGAWAACSYGSWQIMFPVAVELGFRGRPQDLWDDEVGVHWVLAYLDRRVISRECKSVVDLADAYNSGSFRDGNIPKDYIAKFMSSYETVVERRGLK